ncbi:CdaR family protein [Sporosarcina thermotolerans]|uniref:CdaR family protein n=1 Tax=Sporosarcina thermotolerans TaxID=633404 RepID=A0AAW9A771_9BACL|nr:CdaR family protein [Sporosarcina thermotolerans]MDW0116795.1 CdaR family protein [Sporosarcina thermotolerans]WHT48971.1 CdaR family protein [Sporosarcina thermotolerans]
MDKFMDRPWFLRFTALALAIILFFSVKAEDEKTNGSSIGEAVDIIKGVPLEVYYDEENYVVTGAPKTVDVTIKGPSSLVQSAKLLRDFTLKVDLRPELLGRHTLKIQTENLSDKLDVKLEPGTVEVLYEEKITQTFRVDPELNERLLAEDFNVVKMEVEPARIEVTGAKSVIEAISFVKVSATGDKGINKSFNQKARVRVLDRDLNKLDVKIVPEEVTVKVEIEEYNTEVPIVLRQRGIAGEDVTIDSIYTDAKTIRLHGPKKVLDSIKEIVVDVDISKIKESGSLELNVQKPKGVSQISLDKIRVNITATVKSVEDPPEVSMDPADVENVTKEFKDIPVDVRGLDSRFKSVFREPENGMVDLTVTAKPDVINALSIANFKVSVDASKTDSEGEYIYPLIVEAPENIAWKLSEDEVTMEVKLA